MTQSDATKRKQDGWKIRGVGDRAGNEPTLSTIEHPLTKGVPLFLFDTLSVGCEQRHRRARKFSLSTRHDMFIKRSALNRLTAYDWYRVSPSWHERRKWILKRANGVCEKCRKRPATEVHHLTYKRVFNEDMADLIALCRQCHAEIHWRQPANDNQIQLSFDFPETPDPEEEEG